MSLSNLIASLASDQQTEESSSNSVDSPFPFSQLPSELRRKVYEYATEDFVADKDKSGIPPWCALSHTSYHESMPVFIRSTHLRVRDDESMQTTEAYISQFKEGKSYVRKLVIGNPSKKEGVTLETLHSSLDFALTFPFIEKLEIYVSLPDLSIQCADIDEQLKHEWREKMFATIAGQDYPLFPLVTPAHPLDKLLNVIGLRKLVGYSALKHISIKVARDTVNQARSRRSIPSCHAWLCYGQLLEWLSEESQLASWATSADGSRQGDDKSP